MLQWFIVQTASQYEKKVKERIEELVKKEGRELEFGQILVPVEEVAELKAGQKKISERKLYPGYVFVEMEWSEANWHLVKKINKVTGFVGGTAHKPAPMSTKEVENLLAQLEQKKQGKPKPKVMYAVGEEVRICDGSFVNFSGSIESVNYDRNKLKILITVFGRATPVELDFDQVARV